MDRWPQNHEFRNNLENFHPFKIHIGRNQKFKLASICGTFKEPPLLVQNMEVHVYI